MSSEISARSERASPAPCGNLREETKGGRKALRGQAWGQTWMSNNKDDWDDERGVDGLAHVVRIAEVRSVSLDHDVSTFYRQRCLCMMCWKTMIILYAQLFFRIDLVRKRALNQPNTKAMHPAMSADSV